MRESIPPAKGSQAEEQVSSDEEKEEDGDHSVHREKGCVELGEVVGGDERMLVKRRTATETTPAMANCRSPNAMTSATSRHNMITWNSRAAHNAPPMPK